MLNKVPHPGEGRMPVSKGPLGLFRQPAKPAPTETEPGALLEALP
jgi:hypothetical protein